MVLFGLRGREDREQLKVLQIGYLQILLSLPNTMRMVISTVKEREETREILGGELNQ